MTNKNINNYFIPNVTKTLLNKQSGVKSNSLKESNESDFSKLLKNEVSAKSEERELTFSGHAMKRLEERNIELSPDEFLKLKGALSKLKAKGGKDSLVITDNAAYIIDVKNDKVVTAMDKQQLSENVFTKIDSTLFM